MKTPEELVSKMLSEMPYVLNAKVLPYLFELAELAQTEAWNEAIDLAAQAVTLKIDNIYAHKDGINIKSILKLKK